VRQDGPERRAGWRVAVLCAVVLATYANALGGPFIFDDQEAIVDNIAIRDLGSRAVIAAEREAPVAGRPVVNLSLALNYAAGGLNVRGYHAVNILLHALCALAVFGFLVRTFGRRGFSDLVNAHRLDLAFAAALVWAVHPLNSEVVDYTTERTESMMALCYLLTMYSAIRALDVKRGSGWILAAIASCAIGMGCKESMVTAPVMVVIFDRVFAFTSLRNALTARWRLYAGLAATWTVLVAATWSGPRIHSAGFSSGMSPWTYLLNQPGMIVQYLRLAAWPQGLVLDYGEPAALTLADALPQSIFVVLLLASTAVAFATLPSLGFFGAWFFVTLAPTSSILPIATEVGAERRMYLPLVAVVAVAALFVAWLCRPLFANALAARRLQMATAFEIGLLAVTSIPLAALTIARNREYVSSLVMAQTVCDRWPTPTAHAMLGVSLEAVGRHDEAVDHLRQSAAAGYSRAHYHLGGALFNHHQTNESIHELNAFLDRSPELFEAVNARMLLARAYMDEQQWPLATEQLRQVLVIQRANVDALGLLADSLFAQQQLEEAIARYRVFLAERPTDVGARINLGVSYATLGRTDEAQAAFRTALQVDARDVRVHRNLAALALNVGDAPGAERAARQAVALAERDALAHDLLGRALGTQGRVAEARAEFEKALAIDPSFAQARDDLALVRAAR